MLNKLKIATGGLFVGLVGFCGTAHALDVDPKLPDYKKTVSCSGPLNSVGSDTLNNLMTLWAEAFRKVHPDVKIQIEGKGSSTAPPALIAGTSQLGPMSRMMKAEELEKFESKFGYKPTPIGVALDSLAVFVHRDNPIKELSLQQVDAIFSKTRKGGLQDMNTWGQLGLGGEWSNRFVSLYGRNSASGTYGYFKKKALFKGDFKKTVKEQPGSASVVMGISEDLGGVGYSGIGYITSSVKALPLSKTNDSTAYEPNYENVLKGKYPLGRMLYVYVAKKPNQPLDSIVKEFFKLVLSKRGQEIVIKDGYLPLPAVIAAKQLKVLD
jgi:phosphate transport system substrate-binding protein